jgi:hypothetical protein
VTDDLSVTHDWSVNDVTVMMFKDPAGSCAALLQCVLLANAVLRCHGQLAFCECCAEGHWSEAPPAAKTSRQ